MPLEGTPWGLAELHQPHPSDNNNKKRISLLWAHFPSPQSSQFRNPCKDPKTAGGVRRSGVEKLTCGVADKVLGGKKEGMRKEKKEKVHSETFHWDFPC